MRHPITKLAVAAALLIGLFYLTRSMIGRETLPTGPNENIAQRTPPTGPERPVFIEEVDSTELQEARRLIEAGDTGRLLTLLEGEREETIVAVARYLEHGEF